MKMGMIGLPQTGKSTLFRLLTAGAETGRGRTGVGIARVPDERIATLANMYNPRKTTYATLELVDIDGFMPGQDAARFLSAVQDVDALVQVVRAFDNPQTPASLEGIDAAAELFAIQEELATVDWSLLENRLARIERERHKVRASEAEVALLARIRDALEEGTHLRRLEFSAEERRLLQGYAFYTAKPLVVVVNVDEGQLQSGTFPGKDRLYEWAERQGVQVIPIASLIEWEIAQLDPDDRRSFMEDIGLEESGVARLANGVYEQLGLISFFTVGEDEVRAWTIRRGMTAQEAAGKIHSDIARGFIRAEVVAYDDLVRLGSLVRAREEGVLRLEGKTYVMNDGDVVSFRFNV